MEERYDGESPMVTKMRAHAPHGGLNAMSDARAGQVAMNRPPQASLPEIADRMEATNDTLDMLHQHLDELAQAITGDGMPGTLADTKGQSIAGTPIRRIDDKSVDQMHRVQHAVEKLVRIRGLLFG